MQPTIKCKYDQLVPVGNLAPHPKNANKHSKQQIERLAKLFEYQGVRHPIIVSKLSNKIVAGHGRLEALKHLGATQAPVVYQEFKDTDQEIAFLHSDNAIADWAEIDMAMINEQVADLGPEFDIDWLGFDGFQIDPPMFGPGSEDDQGRLDQKQLTQCPKCGDVFDHAQNKFED